jgi:hypothetical protein
MAKSSVIIAPITLIFVGITALVNNYCCLCSPLAAVILGLIAGGLCVYFEKPADAEKAAARGAIAGTIAGLAALVGQTIGGTIILLIVGAGKTPVACLPGLCELASAQTSQASWVISSFFSSCFCGLMLLPIMAGLGALGGMLWFRYGKKMKNKTPSDLGFNPSV